MFDLSHASMIKVQYMSKWCNPLYLKVTSIQKWLKPIFIVCIPYWLAPKSLLPVKGMTPNFVVFISVLSYWLPYLCIFVAEFITLLGAFTDKWV